MYAHIGPVGILKHHALDQQACAGVNENCTIIGLYGRVIARCRAGGAGSCRMYAGPVPFFFVVISMFEHLSDSGDDGNVVRLKPPDAQLSRVIERQRRILLVLRWGNQMRARGLMPDDVLRAWVEVFSEVAGMRGRQK
jgi:hypothetical protein